MRNVPDSSTRSVQVVRVADSDRRDAADFAVVEEPLQIIINGKPFAVIMRTPGADRDLAVGFLLGERIVLDRKDLLGLSVPKTHHGVVRHNAIEVSLGAEAAARLDSAKRAVTTTSSCGLCGRQTIDALVAHGLEVRSDLTVSAELLATLPPAMRQVQAVFDRTGGLHAAALFRSTGTLVAVAEDVGRHNATDKVTGARWLADEWPLGECLLCVSGRLSYEIVLKALIAGIPIIAAVSAPSTLAIDLAANTGITLAGFVRDRRMNVYTHPDRILGGEL